MSKNQRSADQLLDICRRITSLHQKSLLAVLVISLAVMLIQAITDITEVAAAAVFAFALWLLAGLAVLIICLVLRLKASALRKQEAEAKACESEQARIRQITTFRAAEEARELALEQSRQAPAPPSPAPSVPPSASVPSSPPAPQESPLAAGLPDLIPTVKDSWKEKALSGRSKADALEGRKPDIYNDDWQTRLIGHAERLNRYAESDIELMRKEVKDEIRIFRMRERIGYYYMDVCKPTPDGTLVRKGWGPLSALNVLHEAYPDHPEVIARLLAAAGDKRPDLEQALDDLMESDARTIVAGIARTWNDMLYLSRETMLLFRSDSGLELRFHTEKNPTPRNPDPRKIHTQRRLSIPWSDISPRSAAACLRLFRERNPITGIWWIGKLAANAEFLALFTPKE